MYVCVKSAFLVGVQIIDVKIFKCQDLVNTVLSGG